MIPRPFYLVCVFYYLKQTVISTSSEFEIKLFLLRFEEFSIFLLNFDVNLYSIKEFFIRINKEYIKLEHRLIIQQFFCGRDFMETLYLTNNFDIFINSKKKIFHWKLAAILEIRRSVFAQLSPN